MKREIIIIIATAVIFVSAVAIARCIAEPRHGFIVETGSK